MGAQNLSVKTVFYYSGHILAAYKGQSVIDVFRVNGPLVDRYEMETFFEANELQVTQIETITMPRLDW